MNFEQARFNMVQQQVRTWEVLDSRILDLLAALPREDFVEPQYRKLAYADTMLPLRHGEVMMKPVVEGRLLQSLEIEPAEHVLEVGTGSGYLTACLAKLGASVTSLEQHEDFVDQARRRLEALGLGNAHLKVADVMSGWQPERVYDVIAITGAVHELPPTFLNWLAPGGRLFAICGRSPAMDARLYRTDRQGRQSVESLFETDLPHLAGAGVPERLSL